MAVGGPANPSLGMSLTIKLYSAAFTEYNTPNTTIIFCSRCHTKKKKRISGAAATNPSFGMTLITILRSVFLWHVSAHGAPMKHIPLTSMHNSRISCRENSDLWQIHSFKADKKLLMHFYSPGQKTVLCFSSCAGFILVSSSAGNDIKTFQRRFVPRLNFVHLIKDTCYVWCKNQTPWYILPDNFITTASFNYRAKCTIHSKYP